jgi:hypothetical protein
VVAEISRRGDAIAQIVLVQSLLQADGNGLQIASGEAAVGRIAFRQDQQVLLLRGENAVVGAKKTADVRHAVFLCRHGAAVAQREHLLRDLLGRLGCVAIFPQLDEVSILRESGRRQNTAECDSSGTPR